MGLGTGVGLGGCEKHPLLKRDSISLVHTHSTPSLAWPPWVFTQLFRIQAAPPFPVYQNLNLLPVQLSHDSWQGLASSYHQPKPFPSVVLLFLMMLTCFPESASHHVAQASFKLMIRVPCWHYRCVSQFPVEQGLYEVCFG